MGKKQPVNIGGISCDALLHHEESLESDIPNYPVEEGFSIQDTIILKPKRLVMTVFVTNTPVTFGKGTPGRVQQVAGQLRDIYMQRKLITVTSSKGVYDNMGIESISLPYDVATRTSLEINLTLKEVKTVKTKTTTIPAEYGRGGETGVTAGTASCSPYTGSNVLNYGNNITGMSKEDMKKAGKEALDILCGGDGSILYGARNWFKGVKNAKTQSHMDHIRDQTNTDGSF